MPAKAARSPFDSSNWYLPVSETYKSGPNKGTSKKSIVSGNMEWDMGGWHWRRRNGWQNKPKNGTHVAKVQRRALDGHMVTAYVTEGYDDYIGFHPHADNDSRKDDPIAFAEAAFSEASHDTVYDVDGAGHIAHLRWAEKSQVLDVTFADGAECYYFKVPSAIAGTLLTVASAEATNPTLQKYHLAGGRHKLGVLFWDLIRIRGQRTGSRYPFEYVSHSKYQLTGRGGRYLITLTPENARYIFKDVTKMPAGYKPGSKVTAVLTEDEYQRYIEYMQAEEKEAMEHTSATDEKGSNLKGRNGKHKDEQDAFEDSMTTRIEEDIAYTKSPVERAEDMIAYNQMLAAQRQHHWDDEKLIELLKNDDLYYIWVDKHPGPKDTFKLPFELTKQESSRLKELRDTMDLNAKKRNEAFLQGIDQKILNYRSDNPEEVARQAERFGQDNTRDMNVYLQSHTGTSKFFNHKDGGLADTLKKRYQKGARGGDLDPEDRSEYNALSSRESDKLLYSAQRRISKPWTPSELAEMGKHPGEIGYLTRDDDLKKYNAYISTGQYDMALNHLKHAKVRIYEQTPYGAQKLVYTTQFAGPEDYVDYDEE